MAYLRLGHIKQGTGSHGKASGLFKCIDYIFNPAKTNNGEYIGGYNLVIGEDQVDSAFDSMIATKKVFEKEDGRQGYHFKLSFAANDEVDPKHAMKLTEEFCKRCFRDYEVAYAVHNNTVHLHSHLVINSIDMLEGRKYHYKKGDWAKTIQPVINEICRENNLSEIDLSMDEEFILKHKCKPYKENIPQRVFYSNAMIRSDVDACVQLAESYDEFINLMQRRGHIVDDTGKHIKVTAPGRERSCRLYSLTPDKQTYTKENIKRMIAGSYMTREEVKEKLFSEWNSFRYVKIKIQFVKIDLGLLRIMEERRLALENNLASMEDAEAYLDYLNRADKEMNIIRKKVKESLDERREVLDQVEKLMSLLKYRDRYQQGEKVFKPENDRVEELSNTIAAKGYHLEQLYRYKNIGEALIKNIDDYKKHLYVDGQICKRIISGDSQDFSGLQRF